MPSPSTAGTSASRVRSPTCSTSAGVIVVDASRYSEDDLIVAIDAGAEDIAVDDDVYEIVTEPADLPVVHTALEEAGVEVESAESHRCPRAACPSRTSGRRRSCASSRRSRRATT